jgi:hypothetical protein
VIIRLFQDVTHAGIGVFGLFVFALLAATGEARLFVLDLR